MSTAAQEAKARKYTIEKKKGKIEYNTRAFSRCRVTGRAKGYMRYFQVSRITFRELALKGLIPGVKKASW